MGTGPIPDIRHKAICYDDEGRLDCCCELRPAVEAHNNEEMTP